ncbi:MAG: hypothetical protein Q8S73_44420 [Deltaproteobacteria bacterium]|nr:hypothetical protein [Myxococcales bacterium]MDP3221211.1 hypothetical protein [Deltaproteobacteria bacterium]
MTVLFLLGFVALVIGVPTAMWIRTWPDSLEHWLPHVVGTEHITRGQFRDAVVARYRGDGPPVAVRLAALGAWILGTMFVPGLMLGVSGLFVAGIGVVSIPGLVLAWRLFALGRPLLLADPEAAVKARGLARFARILNYVVLACCGLAGGLQLLERWGHGHYGSGGVEALILLVATYAGISLAHAALLDRAAEAIDEQHGVGQPALAGVRIDLPLAAGEIPTAEGMPEELSEEARRARRG